ncbi:MAG: aminotransferase class V-fold PLP-dependent enzyme, partial [Nanoarchaeota archaeon]
MIYLDYAAAAPVRKEVRKVVAEMEKYFANPSSTHYAGRKSKELLENSRERMRDLLNAEKRDKIIFTSSGTESINLAIKGITHAYKKKGKHIITSKVEHKAVLETCKYLEQEGFKIT